MSSTIFPYRLRSADNMNAIANAFSFADVLAFNLSASVALINKIGGSVSISSSSISICSSTIDPPQCSITFTKLLNLSK